MSCEYSGPTGALWCLNIYAWAAVFWSVVLGVVVTRVFIALENWRQKRRADQP